MLSQRHRSLVGCDSRAAAAPHQLLARPPQPPHLRVALRLQHQLGLLFPPIQSLPNPHTARTSREDAVLFLQQHFPRQTAKKVGGRSMMPTSTSLQHTNFHFATSEPNNTAFSFRISPHPAMALTFPPRPSPPRPRKRGRAVTDIDGEHSCLHKKKRRLRLFLITSRLSPQFSHPATNIVDRGSSKIAVWAKQKSLGRNLLRKAAILNRIRRKVVLMKEKEKESGLGSNFVNREQEQKQLELAKLAFVYGSHDTHTRPVMKVSEYPPACEIQTDDHFETPVTSPTTPSTMTPSAVSDDEDNTSEYRSPNDAYAYSPPKAQLPRKSYIPLPPSPLGLSNYDAFDLEDDYDPYANFDDDEEDDTDARSPSATTSASFTSTLSTAGTGASVGIPPQVSWCDFNVLDHEEPVVGDYDQVDQGADAIWPNMSAGAMSSQSLLPASSSPNFSALFSTSTDEAGPFSPNFAAALPEEPSSKQRDNELEQERNRQRKIMFMQFES